MDEPDRVAIDEVALSVDGRWRRTSPLAIVFYVGRVIRRTLTDGLPALAPLAAIVATRDGFNLGHLVAIISAGAVIAGAWGVATYLRFRYRTERGGLVLRQGVVERKQINVDFDRIQNVAVREPFYMRPFGLAAVALDTAGSTGKEVEIAGIPLTDAYALRDIVHAEQQTAETFDSTAESSPESDSALLTRSRRDLAIYGLMSNNLVWIAVVLGALLGNMDELWTDAIENAVKSWVVGTFGPDAGLIAAVVIVLAVLILLPVLSIAGALIRHDGFRLNLTGSTFRRFGGLISRHEESLRRTKIQAIEASQNAIGRLFGRYNLKLRVTEAGTAEQQAAQMKPGGATRFIVPAVTRREWVGLIARFLPGANIADIDYSSIDRRRYMTKYLALGWTPVLVISLIIPTLAISPWFAMGLPTGLGMGALILWQAWKRIGYAVSGEFGLVRGGFIGMSHTVFPLFKVQRVDLSQSPAMRRHRLAHLTVHLASHSIKVPCMPLADAQRLRDLALYHAQTDPRPWF